MELRYRVVADDRDVAARDVRVELADDATVGELAGALAAHCGLPDRPGLTLAVAGRSPAEAGAPAAEAAPRSGSTVRLATEEPGLVPPPWWSPVTLTRVDTDRDGAVATARLPYGTTSLGAARIRVDEQVTVQRTAALDRVEVDGAPVPGGARAGHGSFVRVGDAVFEVRIDGPLRPPPGRGPWRRHGRVPAVVVDVEPTTVTLPTPPTDDRTPGFPFLSAAVPLLMGAAMWLATGSPAVAGLVLFSVAFVVASGIEVRREHRRDRRFREATFRDELRRAEERARALRHAEAARAERDLPSGAEVAAWASVGSTRIWERTPDGPSPLRVRLGTEEAPAADPVVVPEGGRADLRVELEAVAARLATVARPAEVDLGAGGLAVCGTDGDPAAVARSVVLQLAATVGPEHLSFVLDAGPGRAAAWRWLWWLPHRVTAAANGWSPGTGSGERLALRVVDRLGAGPTGDGGPAGPGTVWVSDSPAGLPHGLAAVVVTDRDGRAGIRRSDGPATALQVEGLDVEACEPAARALTCRRAPGDDDAVPDSASLHDLVEDGLVERPRSVVAAWSRSRADAGGLHAPLGRARGGIVHLDLTADGPHGLVAGTTGAGKSELLRTIVASIALHHPPDRVTFLLVDYKGGAAFLPLVGLPHTVGLVTDLGPAEARRALTSLRAEVRRRERSVADAGVASMAEVPAPDRSPALVVVVDEFATLAAELPALLDGLLDVAQRGRSLGVHLLLATQRPAGVVTDAIRANLSLRISLRVADRDDSRDVVDTDAAALLPSDRPGRAVLRLGPGRHTTLQVATTAVPTGHRERVRCHDLVPAHVAGSAPGPDRTRGSRPGATDADRTVLDAVVDVCARAAALDGAPPPRRPWVAPLPRRIFPADLPAATRPGALVVGLVDRPDEQRLDPLELDLGDRGGLLVVGAPRSGRSSALRTLAAAAIADPRRPTVVQALDGWRGLRPIEGLTGPGGGVTDVIAADDAERVLRLLRTLLARCRRGDPADEHRANAARRLLLVDGVGTFAERHERVNRGEAIELLVAIATEGPAAGVHLAVSATRPAELPPALLAAVDRRLVLRCASTDDAAMLGVEGGELPTLLADPELPAGRGLFEGELVQLATPPGSTAETGERRAAPTIGRLPTDLDVSALPDPIRWCLPVGLRADDLSVAHLDLGRSGALVMGPPRSGRTTALALLADLARRATGATVVPLDGHAPDGAAEVLRTVVDAAEVGELGGPEHPVVVAVDDLPELLDGPDGAAVDELLQRLLRLPPSAQVRLLASAEADAAGRCWADSIRRLRAARTGVLLRPDPDLHPPLLHTALPRHDELPAAAGRGWLVSPDGVVAVQLARPR